MSLYFKFQVQVSFSFSIFIMFILFEHCDSSWDDLSVCLVLLFMNERHGRLETKDIAGG